MATIIEQAVKGQRKAMKELYEKNKRKVYYVSMLLLQNEADAVEATNYAFKSVWGSITANNVTTEDEFTHLAIRKVVGFSKKKIEKTEPKAFRMPKNRNFLVTVGDKNTCDGEDIAGEIVKRLPSLQRFILVLHSVGEYLSEQIATSFKFDMKTLALALEAECTNIERELQAISDEKQSYEWVLSQIRDAEESITLPKEAEEFATAVIDAIALPIERKKRRMMILIIAGIVAFCVLVAGIVVVATQKRVEAEETSSSVSDSSVESSVDETNYTPTLLDESLTYYADIEIENY